jgi:hypothetical protein
MKKSAFLTPLITAALFSALVLIGCKKENSDTLTPQQEEDIATVSSESEAQSQLTLDDVFDNVMGVNNDVGMAGTGVFGRVSADGGRLYGVDSVPHCFTVTITHLSTTDFFPLKIVLDFGTQGCTSNDGHTRYGKIITTYTGRLITPGKSATTTFEGYKIDSISVQGTHKITNTTALGSNQRQFTVEVTDAKLTKPSGNYIQWEGTRVITQVEGNGTPDLPLDDVFTITGSGHGKVKRGNDLFIWQSEITEPLRKKFICHWISKGILKVRRETLPATSPWVSFLNYGNGACDFDATLTINGVVHQIQLPH